MIVRPPSVLPRCCLPPLLVLVLAAPAALSATSAPQLIPQMWVWGPPGWTSGIVPRMAADGTVSGALAPSESLLSTQPTYINWSTYKNPAVCGTWTDALYLDDQLIQTLVKSDCEWASKAMPATNQGPTLVRGGRHQIGVQPDLYLEVCTDYSFPPRGSTQQFVWSPMPLSNTSLSTSVQAPPPPGWFAQPNCDGYEIDRTNSWAWVASSLGYAPANNADLVVYDDPWRNDTTGFSHVVARSAQGPGVVDFVVGGESATPAFFPAVIQGDRTGPTGSYALGWTDAENRRGSWGSEWLDQSMGARFAVVHEVYMDAGSPLSMDLTRTGGTDDLAFAIFPPTPGGVWSRDQALAVSTPYQGDLYDALTFTATTTGWYPLVVYRASVGTVGGEADYSLRMSPWATIGVPAAPLRLSFSAPAPNPAVAGTRFSFTMPAAGAARISIVDLQGRCVRTLLDGTQAAGVHPVAWDLRDDAGAGVAAGLYWAQLETAGRRLVSRIVVTR